MFWNNIADTLKDKKQSLPFLPPPRSSELKESSTLPLGSIKFRWKWLINVCPDLLILASPIYVSLGEADTVVIM